MYELIILSTCVRTLRYLIGMFCLEDAYELEDHFIARLKCSYKILIWKKGKAKYIRIDNDDELLDDNHFKLSEISLKVQLKKIILVTRNICYLL